MYIILDFSKKMLIPIRITNLPVIFHHLTDSHNPSRNLENIIFQEADKVRRVQLVLKDGIQFE